MGLYMYIDELNKSNEEFIDGVSKLMGKDWIIEYCVHSRMYGEKLMQVKIINMNDEKKETHLINFGHVSKLDDKKFDNLLNAIKSVEMLSQEVCSSLINRNKFSMYNNMKENLKINTQNQPYKPIKI